MRGQRGIWGSPKYSVWLLKNLEWGLIKYLKGLWKALESKGSMSYLLIIQLTPQHFWSHPVWGTYHGQWLLSCPFPAGVGAE